MNKSSSLKSSPEGLQPVSAVVEELRTSARMNAQLIELHTEDGPVYLRPTGWQRFWLQRAFRHFRVLPPQLLSGRNRRRIVNLLATSVVNPTKPVTAGEVFGVVAQVHGQVGAGLSQKVKETTKPPKTLALVPLPATQPATQHVAQQATQQVMQQAIPVELKPLVKLAKPAGSTVQNDGLWQWVAAGIAAAACIPLIMGSVYGVSLLSGPPEVSTRPAIAPVPQAVAQLSPTAPAAPIPMAIPEKHRRRLIADVAKPAVVETSAPAKELRFVSELPPGHFAYPVMRTEGLAGEVRLKATIGADGSVQQVTVLSGNPKLAEAATRAVRRWHYLPNGEPVAAETEIKMKFFGPDAVSIASVAASPAS